MTFYKSHPPSPDEATIITSLNQLPKGPTYLAFDTLTEALETARRRSVLFRQKSHLLCRQQRTAQPLEGGCMTLNPDGYSIKGCSIIYAPKGQAGEYARLATNPYRGCGHKCAYCYVPAVLRMPRAEFDAGAHLRPDYLSRLEIEAAKYRQAGITENVLLSFTTDPYHPGENIATRNTIQILQANGLRVTTLTKGGRRALRDLDLFRPGLDHFASTLTSTNGKFSALWERGATVPGDRMDTLETFHNAGIFTWVSLEPVLSADETLRVIRETADYVDFYKVGKANYITLPEPINWAEFTVEVTALLNSIGKAHYVKKDLQPYLPAGYKNTRLEAFTPSIRSANTETKEKHGNNDKKVL